MSEQSFADWLIEQMEAAGVTGREVAELATIDGGSVSRLRNGKQKPTPEQIWKLQRIFDGSYRAQLALDRLRSRATLPMAGPESTALGGPPRRRGPETRERVVAPFAMSTPSGRVGGSR